MWKLSLVLAFFMSSACSGFLINSTDFLFYFRDVSVNLRANNDAKVESVEYNNTNTKVTYDLTSTDRNVDLVLTFDGPKELIKAFQLNMSISANSNGYWSMANVTGTVSAGTLVDLQSKNLVYNIIMEAPLGQSFTCGRYGKLYPAFKENNANFTPVIEIRGVQIQPFNVTDGKFGDDTWECVGFFTIGIWSGIFITAILIGIITWGLAMIMDVKTMDRFDDPKGKPIAFGAGE